MQVETEHTTDEIRRLRACINDLVSLLALPAIWTGHEPSQIGRTLLDALVGMLRLDFAYLRLLDSVGGAPIEIVQVAQRRNFNAQPEEIGRLLNPCLTGQPSTSSLLVPNPVGEGKVSIAQRCLGLQDELGVLVAGSTRADFPTETERLQLDVAANQAVMGLQEARRSNEQRRVAEELDRRVAQRTRELMEREAKIRRLVDANITGIVIWDIEGRILEANEAFLHMVQYDRKDLLSGRMCWTDLTPPEWRGTEERSVAELRAYGVFQPIEKEFFRKDGTRVPVMAGGALFEEGGNEGVAFVMDITERKRAEEERERLRQALADLAHITRVTTMGELTASLAHEIKQPMAAAVTDARTCLRWLGRDEPELGEAREAAARVVKDVTRASDIISRIGLLFKKGASQRELLDVNEIIQEMIVLLRNEASRYSISIRSELASDLPKVIADRVQLQQVLMNLMLNGIEAMKDLSPAGELMIRSRRENGQAVISVSDTGVGLPPERAHQIFDPFFTTKPEGTGMGLTISRSIVESHDGRLWATPNPERGATLHFTLPTAAANVIPN
ncbi:MAG TPA: ATP-binding protein [Candidatus Acidoferrum sp.]|nr:ATP-binding protein [Candidatus Acidoferrum sp.]